MLYFKCVLNDETKLLVNMLFNAQYENDLRYWHFGPLKSVGHWHFWWPMQLPPFKQGGLHVGRQSGTVVHSTFPGLQEPFLQNTFTTVDESGNWYPSAQLIVHALMANNNNRLVSCGRAVGPCTVLTPSCISFSSSLGCWETLGNTTAGWNVGTTARCSFSDSCTCSVFRTCRHFRKPDYKQLNRKTQFGGDFSNEYISRLTHTKAQRNGVRQRPFDLVFGTIAHKRRFGNTFGKFVTFYTRGLAIT